MSTFMKIAATACIGFACVAFAGCESTDEATTQSAMISPGALCDCGYEKGSDNCCKPGQEICTGCNKFKGSPGCCK